MFAMLVCIVCLCLGVTCLCVGMSVCMYYKFVHAFVRL